ncbi:zinc-dependent metalloprotease [Streptomyces sp. NPDC001351]|uniref:zinc-dependent metalloprotease n=1 Tax=Streptomyces sp. NPDC001351 TaxID=3364564 RepID=UPI0036A4A86A
MVLARLRQLAAHEIGHALRFLHNYASTHHPKPSVMDCPHARVTVTPDGDLDFSDAYATGLGPWDHFLVAHAYGDFADGQLAALRRDAADSGLYYVTEEDGQEPHASHADGVPWVTAGDALEALDTILRVRRIALAGFSRGVLPPDRQTGELEERAVPRQLPHRHEVTAVATLIGGVRHAYGLSGEAGTGTVPVDPRTQRRALTRLTGFLHAEQLALPDAALGALTPPATRYRRTDQYVDTAAGLCSTPPTRHSSTMPCARSAPTPCTPWSVPSSVPSCANSPRTSPHVPPSAPN